MRKKDIIVIFLLLLISVWGLKSLFGGPYYTSQDGIHQIARLYHFKLSLKDGVFPPRWANQAVYGFGYPLFEFNYHLPWYAAMPLILLRTDLFDIMKILHFAAYFFSGVFMYLFLKQLVKNKWAAAAGMILFLVSPYRFLNIYVRNAMGEVFAFMFFPLVLYALIKLAKNLKISNVILLAGAVYGIILSHAISFLLFLPSLVVFGFYCLFFTNNKRKFVLFCVAAAFLFVGLSAYYLFPAYLEKSYTIFDAKFQQIYGRELLEIKRIIYSPWGYSGNGNLSENVMSFQFGIANWGATAIGLITGLYFICKRKRKEKLLILLSFFMIVFSIFLATKYALPVWSMMAKIFAIDFPWKFIGIAVLWSGILFCLILDKIKNPAKYIVLIIILGLAFYGNRNHIRVNKYVSFDIPAAVFFEKSTNTEDEYLPKWASVNFNEEKNIYVKNRILVDADKSTYKISNIQDKNQSYAYEFEGGKSNHTVKKLYFPGWFVFVNGKPARFTYENNGFFNFAVPSGKSKIALIYQGTMLVNACNLISFISFAVLCLSFAIMLIKKK